ncbi:MAG: hypothetical protein IPH58_03745 [Sphingobacteriales bacterium]|nr:hypothetical protein [Sphingobacteriales bacterium]
METNNTSDRAGIMHAHIEACRTSGQTVVSYCKEHRLAASKYYYWQKRLPINAATTPTFTQVTPIATAAVPQLSATLMVCGLSWAVLI